MAHGGPAIRTFFFDKGVRKNGIGHRTGCVGGRQRQQRLTGRNGSRLTLPRDLKFIAVLDHQHRDRRLTAALEYGKVKLDQRLPATHDITLRNVGNEAFALEQNRIDVYKRQPVDLPVST